MKTTANMTVDEMKAKAIRATAEIQAKLFEENGLTRHYNKALFIKKTSENQEFCKRQMEGVVIILGLWLKMGLVPGVQFNETEFLGGIYFQAFSEEQRLRCWDMVYSVRGADITQLYKYLIDAQRSAETKQATC